MIYHICVCAGTCSLLNHGLIQQHRAKLNKRQIEANNRLDEIAGFLQSSRQQSPEPVPVPPPSPSTAAAVVHSTSSECRPPNPERFSGDGSKFRGFLFQCTILFNHSPHCFSHDGAKISFIISHLSGQALDWAESRFSSSTTYDCTFEEFLKEFKQAFNQDSDKTLMEEEKLETPQRDKATEEGGQENMCYRTGSDQRAAAV
uniref:DUF4939 domain-containing protein n=1 Tax=Xiphophorus maculatus TaxID=8083 RepID=A0A3B5PWC5_XIPMA